MSIDVKPSIQSVNPESLYTPASQSLVSVIMPTHNRSDLLPRACRSVLEQTYRDLELIIVDDASTDNTQEVASQLVRSDNRVRYIRNDANVGAPEARNIALTHAKGEYVAFLDDDDEWLPPKLELQVPLMEGHAVVGCLYNKNRRPHSIPQVLGKVPVAGKTIEQFHFDGRGFCPGSMLSRTEYVRQVGGFSKDLAGPEGMDLFMQLVSRFGKAVYIKLPLHIYHTNDSHGKPRITTSDILLRGAEREFEKNKHLRSPAAQRYRLCDIELIRAIHSKTRRESAKHFLSSLRFIDPRRPSVYAKLYLGRYFSDWPGLRHLLQLYRAIRYY